MKLRYTPASRADLEFILDYISPRSTQGSLKVKARIHSVIELIAAHPFAGAITSDPSIRRISTSPYPYLIFYEITGNEIIIHHIRHDARNPDTMPQA